MQDVIPAQPLCKRKFIALPGKFTDLFIMQGGGVVLSGSA